MPTFLTIDGRRLHYAEQGSGEPTVVFESGMGASGLGWAAVQTEVAGYVRAVSYDRAGLGRSDADPAARELQHLARDLMALLDHLGSASYVLVGHSWGGPIVRVAAAERRTQVAGIVLVDPTDETCPVYSDPRAMRIQRALLRAMPFAARAGVLRLALHRATKVLPEPARRDLSRLDGSPAATRTAQAEFASIDDGLAALRADPPDLSGLPVTIISGVRSGGVGKRNRAALTASHEASAARLAGSRHVLATNSGHTVQLSEPRLVAAEVLAMVDTVRSRSSS
jgi:pimeloyl-ACP methyl ester carboxylesterase